MTEPMHQQVLTCRDCGTPFAFGTRDQAFYAQHGYRPPKRCRFCRRARRAAYARVEDERDAVAADVEAQGLRDIVLRCRDCDIEFVWTAVDQAYAARQGWTDPPRYCPPCRHNGHRQRMREAARAQA